MTPAFKTATIVINIRIAFIIDFALNLLNKIVIINEVGFLFHFLFLSYYCKRSLKISFYLSIPALAGASFLGLKDIFETGIELNLFFFYSIIFSFFISYLTIKFFLIYVKKFNLNFFVYYRIFLALILFVIVYN